MVWTVLFRSNSVFCLHSASLARQRRWSREDGHTDVAGRAHSSVSGALQYGTTRPAGMRQHHIKGDKATAQYLRATFRDSPLMHSTPAPVTGDRSKVRVFVRMLKEFERLKNEDGVVGPLSYAVAISVCNSVITVTQMDSPEEKPSTLVAAERLYHEYLEREAGRPHPIAHKARVYSAIMHSYLRGGREKECLEVLRNDMKVAGVPRSTAHYSLAVGAMGRMGKADDAWRLVSTLHSEGVNIADVKILRSLLGGAAEYALARRCVLQYARWGVPIDSSTARAFLQVNLREAGQTSMWGLTEDGCVAQTLPAEVLRRLKTNAEATWGYIVRVGTKRSAELAAARMHVAAVSGSYGQAVEEFELCPDAEGSFYTLSSLMFVCAQAAFAKDVHRDWVVLAEKAFQTGEIKGLAGRSSVFYTRLMCVYAAVGNARKADLLLQHMHCSEKNLQPGRHLLALHAMCVEGG